MADETTESTQRTELSEDRTFLASERTYSSWVGMGLGLDGVALGMQAVFSETEPTWIAKSVATIFIIGAILTFAAARQQACRSYARLHETKAEAQSPQRYTTIAALCILGSVGTCGVLWLI